MKKLDCGHEINPDEYNFTSGYALGKNDETICYDCCAKNDVQYMNEHGKITLYLEQGGAWIYYPYKNTSTWNITNWPNSLSFPVKWYKTGKHNIAGIRYDVWFIGPNGYEWHGVQYGYNSQLCHCKRTKNKVG